MSSGVSKSEAGLEVSKVADYWIAKKALEKPSLSFWYLPLMRSFHRASIACLVFRSKSYFPSPLFLSAFYSDCCTSSCLALSSPSTLLCTSSILSFILCMASSGLNSTIFSRSYLYLGANLVLTIG